MNKKVLKTLEYDKIIEQLKEQATSPAGKELCGNLEPMSDIEEIRNAQQETSDALSRVLRKGSLGFSGLVSPNASIRRLEIGGSLNAAELLALARLLDIAKRASNYGVREREDQPADSLQSMFDALEPCNTLSAEIHRCILSEEEISDDASSKLRQIRRTIHGMNDRIHSALNQIINSNSGRTYLQDALITMRHGRYCLPVKAEYRSQFQGMVHDQSSSGATLFIEPMSVVKLNNELREAYLAEIEEINRILAELSELAAGYMTSLDADFRLLKELDFIFAKANLARKQNAMMPVFNTEGIIEIRRGRHPLLDPKKVVPIDIRLGRDFQVLVVTGPNTGGKTVSLKTVGLLTLMGQAGLHIPAGDRSELSVFRQVYADIGDEQSIEQNLSTFSSHMTNIVSIFKHVDQDSLVLFDELCAGTDPNEGAALATAILDDLRTRGVLCMATTHYSELKIYALSTQGVENASCEFDVKTLSPTYRLLIGVPGKSNAFAISKKIGLSQYLIEDAKQRLSKETESFEDVIADLESSRRTMEREQLEIDKYKRQMQSMKDQLAASKEKLESSRERILAEANEQAAAILREAKETADETIRKFRKYGKNGLDSAAMERDREQIRKKMEQAQSKAGAKPKKVIENNNVPKNLRIGDAVKVLSMNLKGIVHTLPDKKGNLKVQMGILQYEVNIQDLVLINEDDTPGRSKGRTNSMSQLKMAKSGSVHAELNLIGKRTDEAIQMLDKYLDDAYLAHLSSVRIVHGKGTGALRKAVHDYLRRLKIVDSFQLAEYGEGDAGVTIVKFK